MGLRPDHAAEEIEMALRPKASLDDLAVPKGGEAPIKPTPPPEPTTPAEAAPGMKNYAHTLSLRLTAEEYRRLRRYATQREDEGGGRVTHQSIIEAALVEFLNRQG